MLPVIQPLAGVVDVPISIDTSRAVVAEAALQAGASIINDIRGLAADPEIAEVAARARCPFVIMHDLTIETAERLIPDITRELSLRIERALAAGIEWENIIVDPGIGFGKAAALNVILLRRLHELTALGRPILVGTSRKSTLGAVLDVQPEDRIEGTAATVALAIASGADIVRVHDVREVARVARMTDAIVRS